jgi:transposase
MKKVLNPSEYSTDRKTEEQNEPSDPNSKEGILRLRRAEREQVNPVGMRLEGLLESDHLARLLWEAVTELDLSEFSEELVVIEGGRGRSAADPQIMVCLWLYGTSQGVNSARELDRLCVEHLAYIWICGGVSMNYHTLSDFRTKQAEGLDNLMTQVLGRLQHAALVEFDHIAQDGLRVRASAGTSSFHREATLEKSLEQARELIEKVKAGSDEAQSARQQAARERAARERKQRLEAALAEMPDARAAKRKDKKEQARVSTTDPESRVMKMANGGYNPAYNIQLAADTSNQVIVGVFVSNVGSDMSQAPAMVEQALERCGQLPDTWLMDGGFASQASIEKVQAAGPQVLAPVQKLKDQTRDPYQPHPQDSPVIADWRKRMGEEEAKQTYRLRASTIECVNAQARCRHGLSLLRVRGRLKVGCVALWMAITHNLLILLREVGLQPLCSVPASVPA